MVDGRLAFVIAGSKVSECSGQESRLLMVEPDSIAAKYLLAHVSDSEMTNISLRNQKTFAEVIAVAGKQAFPRLRGRVSPYVFRHAFSSDLKSAGCDQAEIDARWGIVSLGRRSGTDAAPTVGALPHSSPLMPHRLFAARITHPSRLLRLCDPLRRLL